MPGMSVNIAYTGQVRALPTHSRILGLQRLIRRLVAFLVTSRLPVKPADIWIGSKVKYKDLAGQRELLKQCNY